MDDWVPPNQPIDATPLRTEDLPDTPARDRTIPATSWIDAPPELVTLGADFGYEVVGYRRRIGKYLLWRSGPPNRGDARYMAIDADDLRTRFTFQLHPDGSGHGTGPDGHHHDRFRTWKESLLAASRKGQG